MNAGTSFPATRSITARRKLPCGGGMLTGLPFLFGEARGKAH